MQPPSGEQHTLVHGDQRAVVVEVGGGLRSYTVAERDVLDGYAEDAMADGGRGQLLAPWPNRIEDGHYSFDGTQQQLPLTEVARHNAIHGLVRWTAWSLVDRTDDRVTLEHVVQPQPGYPWRLRLAASYALADDGLSAAVTASNEGTAAAPYGIGVHPYLSAGAGTVDDLVLTAPAATVLRADERGTPSSRGPVEGTSYDFRTPRRIGDLMLDHAFTDLSRDADGIASVTLADPATGIGSELWMDATFGHLMVFSGDTLTPVRRRRGLAVEPMSCPPNAFRTGEDVIRLEPGESTTGTWGVRPRRREAR